MEVLWTTRKLQCKTLSTIASIQVVKNQDPKQQEAMKHPVNQDPKHQDQQQHDPVHDQQNPAHDKSKTATSGSNK